MKFIITEEQYNRFFKGGPALTNVIIQYMENLMKGAQRKTKPKSRNYGNLREIWCKDGKEIFSVHYYFGEPDEDDNVTNKNFYDGQIYISQRIVDTIKKLFNVREKFVLHVIAEWYDETYAQEFAKNMNEPFLHIHDAEVVDKEYDCPKDFEIPENITDEEMIDFIDKNTGYGKDEIRNMISTGQRDLKDLYLGALETVDEKRIYGF